MENKLPYRPQIMFHPGETLAEKIREMNMSIKEFALRSGKPEKTIIAVLEGKSAITPQMAAVFECVTSIPISFWMECQKLYEEYKISTERALEYERNIEWIHRFPLTEMVRRKWIKETSQPSEQVKSLLKFFSVSSPQAWEKLYLSQKLKIAFSISLSLYSNPYSLAAWLRKGEMEFADMSVAALDLKKLRNSLVHISFLDTMPDDWYEQLQGILASCGVKLATVQTFKDMNIEGCVRWINNTPCIQLTECRRKTDVLWHTVFHEIGHILLHGKKKIFIESPESNIDPQDELEAENFANRFVLLK